MSEEQRITAKQDERFDKMATMLIASVAILVAITAYFQNYSANISDNARRRAQERSIASTQREVTGAIQYSYQWQGAFQTWRELYLQSIAATQNGDDESARRYEKLMERVATLSPMLGPEYFDPAYGWPDTYKYEADTYLVESTRLNELYLAESELGRFTDDVADSLVVQITLLTVSLSLYGLSISIKGRVRWLFIVVGSGIVAFCMLWLSWSMLNLLIRPEVNETAINAYAEGIGLFHQAKDEEALVKFEEAVAADPYYARAYYARGNAKYYLGDLNAAIADYETAYANGMNDTTINWNMGWAYYIAGRYEEALIANERVLQGNPEILGVRMNQAITYLAMGDYENAAAQYEILLNDAEQLVQNAKAANSEPSASLWYYMDAGAKDLQGLVGQIDHAPISWAQAPEAGLIRGDHTATREFALEQMTRLKEATVALEYTGKLPPPSSPTQVVNFTFGTITETNEQGQIISFEPAVNNTFPNQTESFTVEFTYTGAAPKQMIWKVYIDGNEDQSLRAVLNDDISSNTTWYRTFGYNYTNVFVLRPGEYVVELYADSKLVKRGVLYVEGP